MSWKILRGVENEKKSLNCHKYINQCISVCLILRISSDQYVKNLVLIKKFIMTNFQDLLKPSLLFFHKKLVQTLKGVQK